jgi:dTDP-glucose 4,6-dehydratase
MGMRPPAVPDAVQAALASFADRRVVVTGAAGFIGSHLSERLIRLGARVVGIDNLLTGTADNLGRLRDEPRFRFVIGDTTLPYEVPGEVDHVFQLASPASPTDYASFPLATLKAGALGTLNSLTLAHSKGARFVLASTSEVYGDPVEHPQPETYWGNVNPIGPRSMYDEAKRYAEALTTTFHDHHATDTAIVRIFNTYGPRMRSGDGRAVPTFIEQAVAGRPLTVAGDGSQTRSLCYIDDTVTGFLAVASSGLPGPVNIGNPQEISIRDLAEEIRALCRSSSPIEFVTLPGDDPRRRCPDITKARTLLGWTPKISLRDGLERTLAGSPGWRAPAGTLR